MNDKQRGMLLGAFTGDSLALGVHWIYNTGAIDKKAGRVTDLIAPIADTFHPNRGAGEFTHYGDQMLLFLEHVRESGGLNRGQYLKQWKEFFDSYDGYKDHAMKDTGKNLEEGKKEPGSGSTDLAGLLYLPVLLATAEKAAPEAGEEAVSAVKMTHNSKEVIQAARLFTSLLKGVLEGSNPVEEIERMLSENEIPNDMSELVRKGLDSAGRDTRSVINEFGQACPADHGIPGVIHLIAGYEDDFEKALIENVMAGGDSAARGIVTGAVLGAHRGTGGIPDRWIEGLASKKKIESLIK